MKSVSELKENGFAAVCCLLMGEPARRDPRFDPPAVSREVRPLLTRIVRLCEDIEDQQLDHGVERAVPQELAYCGVAEIWASGFSWEALCEISGLSAGDLFRILRRTYDLSRQIEHWEGAPKELRDLARATNMVLLRGPLEENVSFFESAEGDPNTPPESVLPEATLPVLKPLRKTSEKAEEEDRKDSRRHKAPRGVGRRKKIRRRRSSRPGKNR